MLFKVAPSRESTNRDSASDVLANTHRMTDRRALLGKHTPPA